MRDRLEAGGDVTLSAAIVGSWARYAEGVDEQDESIIVVDRYAEELVPLARTQRDDRTAFIRNKLFFGELASDERFRIPYLAALDSIITRGAHATVESLTH